MFGLHGAREEYSGTSAYKYVDPLISNAQELYIISPFIDNYYAKFIKEYSHAKRVYILSSSMNRYALGTLKTKTSRMPLIIAALIVIANVFFLLYNSFNVYVVGISAAVSLALIFIHYMSRAREPIQLKRPNGLYHMKIYVSDKRAIKGSANLTYAGMHKNHESISIFRSPEGINDVKKEFWRIWNTS